MNKKPVQEVYTRHELADRLNQTADFMLEKSEQLKELGREPRVWQSWLDMNLAIVLTMAELCGSEYLPEDLADDFK